MSFEKVKLNQALILSKQIYKPNSEEHLKYIGLEHIEQETLRISGYGDSSQVQSNKYKFESGDILFGKLRPYFRKVVKPKFSGVCSTDIMVFKSSNREKYDQDYLYYMLTTPEIINIATKSATGTRMPRADWSHLGEHEVFMPSLEEQKKIAKILCVLDEKIELNNEMNKTLEEIAQAIFKHWFVDFEFPNENGEPYKSSGGKLVESELGMIPEGWKVATIGDLGSVVGGGTPSKKREDYFTSNGIPWITPKDLSNNKNRYIERGSIDITEEGLKNSSAKLLPKGTVLFSSRAPIGYLAIAKNDVTTNQGFKSVIPHKDIGTEFVFQVLKYNRELIESRASGTTFKEISGGELKKIPIVLPKIEVIKRYNEAVKSLGDLICNNEEEIKSLISIRDSLLPKLMSGEIRVPDAEREVEECLQKSN